MTKIFEALRKAPGNMSDILPELLEQEPGERPLEGTGPGAEPMTQEARDEAMVQAMLGEPEDARPVTPGSKSKTLADPWKNGIRELPVRVAAASPLLPFDDTNRVAAEQYRIIRTRLIQHPKQPRLVLISSGGPGDGKSVTSVNIAGALSLKTEANVLLMDADFRRPTIHRQLGLPASPGLAEVLAGTANLDDALVRAAQFPNLCVIPAGAPCANPSELLDSARWRALCDELRIRFRYMIADSPPVASVADYELLQATCDGVVLVVRPDHTKRNLCQKALQTIPKEKLIGVVVNCVPKWLLAGASPYSGYYYGVFGAYEN